MKKAIYYNVARQYESKFIGIKDGMSQAEFIRDGFINKNHYDEIMEFTSLKNQVNYGNFPDFELNLEYVKMREGAKLTDFISFYPHITFGEYLISDKVVRMLSTFKLPEHKLYPATIDFKGEIINDYKLLFVRPLELADISNIQKSVFFKGFDFPVKNYYNFKSLDEYQDFKKDNFLKAKTLCLNSNFDKNLDLFYTRLSSEFFISEDLRETFEIAGVTGIKFVEAKEPELFFEE